MVYLLPLLYCYEFGIFLSEMFHVPPSWLIALVFFICFSSPRSSLLYSPHLYFPFWIFSSFIPLESSAVSVSCCHPSLSFIVLIFQWQYENQFPIIKCLKVFYLLTHSKILAISFGWNSMKIREYGLSRCLLDLFPQSPSLDFVFSITISSPASVLTAMYKLL